MGSACMFQRQIGNYLQNPGKLGNFPVLALFLHLFLPKIWLIHPHKNYIFDIVKDRAIILLRVAILAW